MVLFKWLYSAIQDPIRAIQDFFGFLKGLHKARWGPLKRYMRSYELILKTRTVKSDGKDVFNEIL